MRAASLLLVALLAFSLDAAAADRWTKPFAGVKRLQRTTSSQKIHALVVDLDMPGVRLGTTPHSLRTRTVSSFGRAMKAQAAVNGDFFNTANFVPNGLSVARSRAWPGTRDDEWNATLAFDQLLKRVELSHPATTVQREGWMWGVVSGHPGILRSGEVSDRSGYALCTQRHPRTGLGLSENGRTLILAVVDGRRSGAAGMTCAELARLLKQLGAHHAVNLDGGGSSAMWLAGPGVVNRPSDGRERVVANHLAIFAPKTSSLGTLSGKVVRAGSTSPVRGATVKLANGRSVKTDARGAFQFVIPAGSYRLTVSAPGHVTQSITRKVVAKKRTSVVVKLARRRAAPVDGVVGSGEPDSACATGCADADADADGLADANDNCPQVENPAQADADDDGQGDACDGDSDDDGVDDADDNCPFVATGDQADADADGTGDACDEGSDEGAEADETPCAATPGARPEDVCEDELDEAEAIAGEDDVAGTGGCASTPAGLLALLVAAAICRQIIMRSR